MSQSLRRGLQLLNELSYGPAGLQDLGAVLGVHRSTTLRLLQAMQDEGYARRTHDGLWSLGAAHLTNGRRSLERFDLRAEARPHLLALADKTEATVHLGQAVQGRIIYLDKIDKPGPLRLYSEVGLEVSLHTSALAKAILSQMDKVERETYLERMTFERYTETTITNRDVYRERLESIPEAGWAEDRGEHEGFVNCISVPLVSPEEPLWAAISVTVFRSHMSLEGLRDLTPVIRETAHRITGTISA